MTVTLAKLKAEGIIDNGSKEYLEDPVCPMIEEATGRIVHCDDPACIVNRRNKFCSFRDHPRGRARWLAMDLDLTNWSA